MTIKAAIGIPSMATWMLAVALIGCVTTASAQSEPPCAALDGSSAVTQMTYLAGERGRLVPDCIEVHYNYVALTGSVGAVPILILRLARSRAKGQQDKWGINHRGRGQGE